MNFIKLIILSILSLVCLPCISKGNIVELNDESYDSIFAEIYDLADRSVDSALNEVDVLLATVLELKNPKFIAYTYYLKAEIYRNKGSYHLVAEYHRRAKEIFDTTNDSLGLGYVYNGLGLLFDDKGDLEEALYFYKKSLEFECPSLTDVLITNQNIARVLVQLKKFKEAKTYIHFLKKKENQSKDDSAGYYYALESIADTLYYSGHFKQSLDTIKRCLRYNKHFGYKLYLSNFYYYLADCYIELANYKKANEKLQKGFELETNATSGYISSYYYILQERIHVANNNYKEAYKALNLYYESLNNLENINKSSFIESIKKDLEFEKKLEQEALKRDLLEKANRVKFESEHRLRNYLIFVIFIITVALVIIIFSALKFNKLNKKLTAQNSVIENTNLSLQENIQLKEKLIGIIAHDTRSPLASTASGLELINTIGVNEEEKKEILRLLELKTKSALEENDNVIKWARAQMYGLKTDIEIIDVEKIINSIVKIVSAQFDAKQISFKTDIEQNCKIRADKNLVRQCLKNLLINAGKFSYEKDEVRLKVTRNDDYCIIKVMDNGVGMSPEELKSLFTLDAKSKKGTQNERGTGLGLLQCHEFIAKMKGEIEVESTKHVGSVFTIKLPLA